jgi:hypothetical protein
MELIRASIFGERFPAAVQFFYSTRGPKAIMVHRGLITINAAGGAFSVIK